MALSDARRDYELVLKILANMVYSKPVALVSISQKTGIKLAELIDFCSMLEKEKIIRRSVDNGNTFYILIINEYQQKVDSLMAPQNYEEKQPIRSTQAQSSMNSRDAILRRRSLRAAKLSEEAAAEPQPEPAPKAPEPISAMDLFAISRSTMTNKRILRNSRTTSIQPKVTPEQTNESGLQSSVSSPGLPAGSGSFRKLGSLSSSSYKAVVMNKQSGRHSQVSRSSFAAMPPAGMDAVDFERSDTNFKQKEYIEPPSLGPIIPFRANVQASNELREPEVRNKLGLSPDEPFVALLTPRPCHDFWTACSAMANVGGGTIIIGMKKYGSGDEASYFVKAVNKPEEAIKILIRSFYDRSVISDCPKDPNFIEIIDFGHKKLLAVHIDPKQLSPAPLYTSKDSFCARDTAGCYTYKNGEVVHCTEDEVKELWQGRRLGNDKPDWNQDSQQVPIQMERKIKLNVPAGFDDDVRPLSRKDCTYGQPLTHTIPTGKHRVYPGKLPPEREPLAQTEQYAAAPKPVEAPSFAEPLAPAMQNRTQPQTASDNTYNPMLQRLLSAEDITIVSPQNNSDKTAPAPKSPAKTPQTPLKSSHDSTTNTPPMDMPPLLADADMNLINSIVAPVIEHPRLQVFRMCEVATELLKIVRLKPTELAELFQRKLVPIRDKVIPKLQENPNLHVVNGYYFIQ